MVKFTETIRDDNKGDLSIRRHLPLQLRGGKIDVSLDTTRFIREDSPYRTGQAPYTEGVSMVASAPIWRGESEGEVLERFEELKKWVDTMGYSESEIKTNHFESDNQTGDVSIQLYIDEKDGQNIERISAQLENTLNTNLNRNPGVSSQLEQLFDGKLDERTLEGLTSDVDAEMQKVTTQTGSTGVIKFRSGGDTGYGKVSTNQYALKNEHNAITAVKNDGLVRILAPTPIGLVKGEGAGALFTWGTENISTYNPSEVQNYFSVFNTLLFSYAQARGLNLRELAKDPKVQDVFNRALIHSSGIDFESVHERPSMVSLEELEQRADLDDSVLKKLREFSPVYKEASKRSQGLNPGEKVFVHGDARPENVGKDPFGVRPLVDWANAHMGYAFAELSSLEAVGTRKYADWYNFVMDFRGGHVLDGESQDLVVCHDVIQPYRTGSFKIGKGRAREAMRDIKRLERNSEAYKDYFK